MLLQCIAVRPDGPDGGALLQHCTSQNKQSQSPVKHQSPTILTPSPSTKHTQSRSSRVQRKKTQSETKQQLSVARSSTSTADTHSLSLRRRTVPRVPLCRISPRSHSRRCCSPPSTEEEEEVQQEEDEGEAEVVEEVGDPTWTPPLGGKCE